MRYRRKKKFSKAYRALPPEIRAKVVKAFKLFKQNQRHPSLRVKKMEGKQDIYEGRIDQNYRFTFHYEDDQVVFRNVGKHDILDDETD